LESELVLGGAVGAGRDELGGEEMVSVSALREGPLSLKAGIFSPGGVFCTDRAGFLSDTGGFLAKA